MHLACRKGSIMPQPEQAREFFTTHFDKVLYTAKAHTTGGPGQPRFSHRLDVRLSSPGTPGTGHTLVTAKDFIFTSYPRR
jgi:hypothetical protein